MQIMNLVVFCPKPHFKVVKQENKVDHVNLVIFPPHLHISLFKPELRLFSYEINHFNMAESGILNKFMSKFKQTAF